MRLKSRIKNKIIQFIFFILKIFVKKNPFDPKNPRILIISTSAIGDTLWATPAIRAIKKKYPNAYLSSLVIHYGKEMLHNNPYLDDIFLLDESNIFLAYKLIKELRRKKIQTVLIFHASQRIAYLISSLIQASTIIGTKNINKGLDFLIDYPIDNRQKHEVIRRLEITSQIGVKDFDFSLDYFPSDTEKEYILDFLNKNNLNKKIIAFQVGAADSYKIWPKDRFIELGNLILQKYDLHLLILGSKKEDELAKEISNQIPDSISLASKFNLRHFAALLEKIDVLITNDTGPMHISTALNKDIIPIFGPTDINISGPLNYPKAHTLSVKNLCKICVKRKCKDAFCFSEITVNSVFDVIEKNFNFGKTKK